MASLGQFHQFVEDGGEDFETYIHRFQNYLRTYKVSDDLKVATFVAVMGKGTYRTLRNLLAPVKPEEKDYDYLVKVLKEHYSPKRMVMAERFQFNSRTQREDETVAAFAVELKKLAASCEFGQFLDEALRDHFITGLRDHATQAELLKRSALTFTDACDFAKSIELARAETKLFQAAAKEPESANGSRRHMQSRELLAGAQGRCSGGSPHTERVFPFWNHRSSSRERVGHMERVYESPSRSEQVGGDCVGRGTGMNGVAIGPGPWASSGEPAAAMSGQLVNWMHRVLPFSKNARTTPTHSPQHHCNAADASAFDHHVSSNASSRDASPLHCAAASSSPARNRAAQSAANAGPEHPPPQREAAKDLLVADDPRDGVGGYEPAVAQPQGDDLPPPPPPESSEVQRRQRRSEPSSHGMDSVEFRQRGQEMVEYIARYMETIAERRVTPQCEPGYLKEMLPDRAPEQPENWDNIMADVERYIMPGVTHWQHPHFHAYFPAGNSYPSILADMLSDGIGCVGFSWAASPACTELEVIMLDWIGRMVNLPEDFLCSSENSKGGGVIQSSASECILNTLLAARYATIKKLKAEQPFADEGVLLSKLMAYCSKEAHSSVEKAAMIGFVKLRILDTDDNFSMRGSTLAAAIEEDRKAGFVPFFVSATLGTTSCCSFDALAEIGPLCQKEGAWLHVDAAYAGSAFICPEFQYLHKGLEYAMSFNINPNKWMLVNFDCSLMWVKDRFKLTQALVVDPLYLQHSYSDKAIDYRHWGIPLSRRFRSLKLWFVVRRYGIKGLQHYIREHVRLAKKFEQLVRSDPRFEVVNEVIFGLVCFRLKGSNQLNEKLLSSINASGKLHMVPASLNDRYVIRFCVCAPNACDADIAYAWHIVSQFTTELLELLAHELDKREEEKEFKIADESADEVFVLERKQHSLRYRRSFFVRMVSDPKLYNPKIVRALSGSTSSEPHRRQRSESSESPTYTGEVVTPL